MIPSKDRSRSNDVKAHDPVKINPPGKHISVHPAYPEIGVEGLDVASKGMLEHALTLAARGWRVLPCEWRGKTALLPEWPERATYDPAEVKALWHRHPEANIGVATGRGSRIFVLDVDGQKGTDSLLDWASKGMQIPDTLCAKTGNGCHFYFALPDSVSIRNSASKLAPGLDVRGEGGYVIAPPSVHSSGTPYKFVNDNVPVAPPPDWLLERLTDGSVTPEQGKATSVETHGDKIPEGQRNANLASFAGTMRRRGASLCAIEAALLEENRARCNPPLPEVEVIGIARSISQYAASPTEGGRSRRPELLTLSNVEAREVDWLWEPYLACGMLAMLSGDPGGGKTYISLAIAAAITVGRVPCSDTVTTPADVLYLSVENSAEHVIRPRFDSLAGEPRRFHLLRGSLVGVGDQIKRGSIRLSDMELINEAVLEKHARLVIVDPIQSYLGAEVDAHRSNQTRPIMDGLSRIAEDRRCCILLVRHLGKMQTGKAIHRGLGSIDLTGAVRTELIAGCSASDPTQRALVPIKSNLGPFGPSLGYTIEDKGMFRWTGESNLTAEALLAAEPNGEEPGALAEAKGFLFNAIAQGPLSPTDVYRLAKQEGISPRTLKRAKAELNVQSRKSSMAGAWEWSLPEGGQQ